MVAAQPGKPSDECVCVRVCGLTTYDYSAFDIFNNTGNWKKREFQTFLGGRIEIKLLEYSSFRRLLSTWGKKSVL